MAEALAIVPIVAQGLQLAGELGSYIKAYRHAGDHVLALANELSDFNLVLNGIAVVGATHSSDSLKQIFRRATEKLSALEDFVRNLEKDATPTKIDRLKWLRMRKHANTMKDELRTIRGDLMVLLIVENFSKSTEINVAVEELKVERESMRSEHLKSMQLISLELCKQETMLSTLTSRLSIAETPHQGSLQSPEAVVRDARFPGAQVPSKQTVPNYESAKISKLVELCTDPTVSHINLSVSSLTRGPCSPFCSCTCHRATKLRTSSMLRSLVGSLFLGYVGNPSGKPKCSERQCKSRSSFALSFTYYFPRWLVLRRAISLQFAAIENAGPEASLRICNVVPFNSDILSAATFGDMTLMRTLLDNHLASPFDISLEGDSALIWATEHGQKEMCKLLLQAGADPNHVNMDGYSAIDVAWTKILGKTSADEEFFLTLYADESDFADWSFTTIHKIVVGLIKADLDGRLMESSAMVNVKDSKGRTPLSWALQRGDYSTARLLLAYGAEPNILDSTGRGMYRWAVLCPEPSCVELLIESGAKVNHPDVYGNTPLHWACWFQKDYRHAEALVAAGADMHFQSYEGNRPTPIHLAFWHGHDKTAAMLLRADGQIPADEWTDLLFAAIQESMTETLQLMIESMDGRTLVPDIEGNTIIHAAAFSDFSVMSVLGSMPRSNVSIWDQNTDGLTALDLLNLREDKSEEFVAAFRTLFDA